jgi:hypothetical protein
MKTKDLRNISVIHADPYPEETVGEIVEKCRQKYFSEGCDKFKTFVKKAPPAIQERP